MFEITGFEFRRRFRGALLLAVSLVLYAGLVVAIFPSIQAAAENIQAYIETLPPELRNAFISEADAYTTLEGFLGAELYQFMILVILGVYFAYAAASTIAGEVENGSLDILLANPVSRTRVLVGKFLALVPVMVLLHAFLLAGTYLGVVLIDESIAITDLVLVHVASFPYLLACAAVGLLASVLFDSTRRAQMIAGGAVFAMFLIDALTLNSDLEWLGDPMFPRYFDPVDVLLHAEVDVTGTMYLVVATVALVAVSAMRFERVDVE